MVTREKTVITDPANSSNNQTTYTYQVTPMGGQWDQDTIALALKDLPNGIFPMGDNGNIGINATAIRTGTLEGITINIDKGGKVGSWHV